jgi:hypothetical protein
MPYNGDGTFARAAGTLIPNQGLLDSSQVNNETTDLISAMDAKANRDGKLPMTGDLPMAGFKVIGSGAATVATGLPILSQLQSGTFQNAATVTGTVDAMIVTMNPVTTVQGRFNVVSIGPNTIAAPTINKDALGVVTIKKGAGVALAIGDTGPIGYRGEYYHNGTDYILLNPATENLSSKGFTVSGTATFDATSLIATVSGPLIIAQGRPTLISNTPIMTIDTGTTAGTGGATRVYYTPKDGALISIFNGTSWGTYWPSEIFFDLSDTAKQPAATVASSGYYLFAWNDGGTIRLIHSPAWTNLTTVSAGAALIKIAGVNVNAVAITNGPAAGQGTCVGWFMTSAANTVLWVANPPAAAGGGNCVLGIGSMYNRIEIGATSKDSTSSWSYNILLWRAANASNSNRITVFNGLNENIYKIKVMTTFQFSNGGSSAGIGLDSTTTPSGFQVNNFTGGGVDTLAPSIGEYNTFVGLGSHFAQWIEYGGSSGIGYGINTASGRGQITSGLSLTGMM